MISREPVNVREPRSKQELENIYAKAIFVAVIWNPADFTAQNVVRYCERLLDKKVAARIREQMSDLDLRHRWMRARYEDVKLPKVHRSVARHFQREFDNTYPSGVTDSDRLASAPHPMDGCL